MIPFFGDQAFWGSAVFRRGVGPKPIPIDRLTTKKLVEALRYMQKPEVKDEARKVAALIKQVGCWPSSRDVDQQKIGGDGPGASVLPGVLILQKEISLGQLHGEHSLRHLCTGFGRNAEQLHMNVKLHLPRIFPDN